MVNADDRYEPGAFAAAAGIFARFTDIDWLTGRSFLIDERGAPLVQFPVFRFPREGIVTGIFDGRAVKLYIQQEGTFWRSWLWDKVGGTDGRFRLAGDFDLWRRFAHHADLVIVDAVLGHFRRREGQATGSLARYHAEIDALSPTGQAIQLETAARFHRGDLCYRKIVRSDIGDWVCEHHQPAPPKAPTPPARWFASLRHLR